MVESDLNLNIEGGGFSKEANVSLETKLLWFSWTGTHRNAVPENIFPL